MYTGKKANWGKWAVWAIIGGCAFGMSLFLSDRTGERHPLPIALTELLVFGFLMYRINRRG